jgi:myo-inositol 2-dehydrogenase / D-chiro-inositol 1-dehydrogenase
VSDVDAGPTRIGVIGAGRIGTVHAQTICWRIPDAAVQVIADSSLAAAEKLAGALGVPRAVGDYRKVLDDRTIDAVLVCSSTDTHAQIVVEAAKARKHIFCEKPIDLDLDRIDQVLAAVKEARVKLQLGFNRRFDPDFRAIKQRLADGAIGKPYLLRITSRDPAPPPIGYIKVSGGIFLDMTIHDFDMARYLLGEVEEVYAAAGVLVDPAIGAAGDVDTAMITLRFANGAIGSIDNCRRAVYGYDQRLEVLGSEGMLCNRNHLPTLVEQHNADGSHEPPLLDFFMQRYTEAYAAELRAFVDAVARDEEPPVGGEDGRRSVILGYAALKSIKEHRPVRVVEIRR